MRGRRVFDRFLSCSTSLATTSKSSPFEKESSFLINGTSRGLGLGFVRELLQQGRSSARLLIPTLRYQAGPEALREIIGSVPDRVKHLSLDTASQDSVNEAVKFAADILSDLGLDVVIDKAGVDDIESGSTPGTTGETLLNTFTINVVAIHTFTVAFLPLLEAGKDTKLINISSTMGSIGMTVADPELYKGMPTSAYNISQAALNSSTIQYAIDLEDRAFTVLPISAGKCRPISVGQMLH